MGGGGVLAVGAHRVLRSRLHWGKGEWRQRVGVGRLAWAVGAVAALQTPCYEKDTVLVAELRGISRNRGTEEQYYSMQLRFTNVLF